MIKRGSLRLISTSKIKKKFKKCLIVLCNESTHEYKLNEWAVYKDSDWIEFHKEDGEAVECFYISNILYLSFEAISNTKTDVGGGLKPVS